MSELPLLGEKGAIYSLPQNITVGAARGRNFWYYVPELPAWVRNFRFLHRNFRWAGYLRGESLPKTFGTPPERKTQNDLAKFSQENFQGRNFRPGGRNFRATGNFRGGTSGEKFWDPSREESQK